MSRVAKLIFVEPAGTDDLGDHNKFYDMTENADGSITSVWGRVDVTSTTTNYPAGTKNWDTLLKSKLKKGYQDVTALRAVSTTKTSFTTIGNASIAQIVQELQGYANKSVSANYTISAEKVTPQMVDVAQNHMNDLMSLIGIGKSVKPVNEKLLEIYRVIPRRMRKVKDHLLELVTFRTHGDIEQADKLIANEQAALDVMQGQAKIASVQQNNTSSNSKTLIDAMGIEIAEVNANDIALIKKHLGPNAHQFRRAFRVVNKRTQDKFTKNVVVAGNKTVMSFWHGSRNENWWSIIENGLVLRPTNAVISGAMFGKGLYFADLARKSIGYCSLQGSYWARGNSRKGFLSLYNVHLGNFLKIKNHEPWCYDLNKTTIRKRGPYDSLFAEGGADLRNNEYIVYDEAQCTIHLLVEISE